MIFPPIPETPKLYEFLQQYGSGGSAAYFIGTQLWTPGWATYEALKTQINVAVGQPFQTPAMDAEAKLLVDYAAAVNAPVQSSSPLPAAVAPAVVLPIIPPIVQGPASTGQVVQLAQSVVAAVQTAQTLPADHPSHSRWESIIDAVLPILKSVGGIALQSLEAAAEAKLASAVHA